jgi:hypothetical protein
MAVSNLQLNVTANTARALADFNKFSRSLDNKFLVSGLKLDVVRSALNQINRDFQRAIGEQGLASASSFRAAQNQAALLTQTFKAFSAESALAITNNIGTALNKVAVTAGGTMKDVQKTLLATPFISTRLGDDVRLSLTKGVMDFQKNFRRAGLGENFGDVAQQFLMGNRTTMQMVQSRDPMEMFLGSELIKRGAGVGEIASSEMRSKLIRDLVEDSALGEQLAIAAKRKAGFQIILEDLNTTLFNPEFGVFGSLKKVVDSAGKSTTMFDEVEVLVEQVFGDSGLFAALVKAIREVFGAGDPMRPFIDAVQFMTGVFKSITDYFNTPGFRAVLGYVKDIIDRVTSVFTGIYRQIRSGGFSAEEITRTIGGIGESIRGYIRKFGEAIRGEDISKESSFTGDIIGTLVEEVGKTAVVLIRELFATLIQKVPEISDAVLPALNRGINSILDEAFGQFSGIAKMAMATMPGPVGAIARASMITDATGGKGGLGVLGAAAPFLLAGGGGLAGMGGRAFTGTGMGATAFRAMGVGLMGADPTLSLLAGFAPQLLGGVPGALGGLNSARRGVMNSGLAGYLSSYGGSAVNLMNRGLRGAGNLAGIGFQGIGNLLSRGAYTASGYLGAVGPMAQRAGGFAVNQLARVENLYNTAYVGARGVGRQFMSGLRPGAFPSFRSVPTLPYQAGQFIRNAPSNLLTSANTAINAVSVFGGNMATAATNAARGIGAAGQRAGSSLVTVGSSLLASSRTAIGNMATAATNAARGIGAAGQRAGSSLVTVGSSLLASSRTAIGNMATAIRNLVASVLAIGSRILASSVAAIGNILVATRNIVASLLSMGLETLKSAGVLVGKIATTTGKIVTSLFTMGTSVLTSGQQTARNINLAKAAVGLAAAGAIAISTQAIGQKIGGSTGETVADVGAISSGALSGIMTAASISALRGVPLGPKGIAIGAILGAITAAIPALMTDTVKNNYAGKDYAGPAMALEARMSGRKPMIVNDGEFVIPRDGFPTLVGLVGNSLRSTGVISSGPSQPIQVNVNLSVTANSVVANADELATALRDPVYKIIGDAWNEAYNANRVHRPYKN